MAGSRVGHDRIPSLDWGNKRPCEPLRTHTENTSGFQTVTQDWRGLGATGSLKDLALHGLALLDTFSPSLVAQDLHCARGRGGGETCHGGVVWSVHIPTPALSSRPVNLWLEALSLVPNDAQEVSSQTRAWPQGLLPSGK